MDNPVINDLTFFTNEENRKLIDRFKTLFKDTKELNIIVGYFYLSGLYQLQEELEKVDRIRIIVGMQTGKDVLNLIDMAESISRSKEGYLSKVVEELSSGGQEDTYEKETAITKFIDWINNGKLEIKFYPHSPLHAKLYIFRSRTGIDLGRVITGSSNFTISGLKENLEFNVELKNKTDVEFAINRFEKLWEKCVDISEDIVQTIKKKTWFNDELTPYELYLKFLYEFFGEQVETEDEEELPLPKGFKKLRYQLEAVLDAERKLKVHGGVFLSDVVGLGKTYIAAMIASRFRKKTLVFAPPHLMNYWEEVLREFLVPAKVESAGKLSSIDPRDYRDYKLVIVDEAHRFRNEDTQRFTNLYEICKGKKVILVTATPYNNKPSDIKAQLLLFQDKRNPTIPGIYDIDRFFANLEKKIKQVDRRKDPEGYRELLKEVGEEIREKVFVYVMVRRTRKEVMKHYEDDLKKQKVFFPHVNPPEKVYYLLDDKLNKLFNETIKTIKSLTYARYKPVIYLKHPYPTETKSNIEYLSQMNLAGLMKVLLLKRLESSFYSFTSSLKRFLKSYKQVLKEFERSGKVYMSKKLNIYELIDEISQTDNPDIDSFLMEIENSNDVIVYEKDQLQESFYTNLKADIEAVERLYQKWEEQDFDPKLSKLLNLLKTDPRISKDTRLLIFTEFAETVGYLEQNLKKEFGSEVIAYTSSSNRKVREKILQNFDPNQPEHRSENDIRILITTDVLAEGVNLHRANVIVNYDIPWNPTRVLQRVGRINRVGTAFSEIYIFNFFPVDKTEKEIGLEAAAVAKLQAFHEALGEDAKYLTEEEETSPKGLFEMINAPVEDKNEDISLLDYIKELQHIKEKSPELFEKIKKLPKKARSSRHWNKDFLITLLKKGNIKKIFLCYKGKAAKEIDFLQAVEFLKVDMSEGTAPLKRKLFYDLLSKNIKAFEDELSTAKNPSSKASKNSESRLVKQLKALRNLVSQEDRVIINDFLSLIREKGLPSGISKKLLKDLKDKPTSEKVKLLKKLLNRYSGEVPGKENGEEQNTNFEVILSQMFVKREGT